MATRGSGRKIELTAREFQLLDYLMQHAGEVVTRKMILEAVWDYHFDPGTNVIDVHISRLPLDPPQVEEPRGADPRRAGRGAAVRSSSSPARSSASR